MEKSLFLVLLITLLLPLKAFSLEAMEAFSFQLGSHTEFYNNIQNDSSGGVRKFDFAPVLGMGALFPIEPRSQFRLIPEINCVLPQEAGSSRIIKNLFMFRGDVAYDPLDWFRLRVGSSFMLANQHGRGGSANVNNGESQSTFYYPDENRSSINNTFDVGFEAMADAWSLRFQTYTYSLFAEERRQYSYSIFLTYYWKR